MRASVVIASYNGADKFPDTLQALAGQTVKDFEVVLVLDGSKDNSAAIANANPWKLDNLIVLDQENAGRSGARNSGVAKTNSDILIFIDDDVLAYPDFIEKHIEEQKKHDVVVGILEPDDRMAKDKDFVNFCSYMNDKWNEGAFHDEKIKQEITYITAANFSIKKTLFKSIGGFDARLRDAEDFDMALKLKAQGVKINLDPTIVAKHMIFGTFTQYMNRMKEYGKAREKLVEVNPLAGDFFKKNEHQFSLPKKVFFYMFSFNFWPKLADKKMLMFIPPKLRYRMYDFMLTANTIFR
ncbi:MAG: glycosyltransferase family 2 protein [Sphingobacteriales bacterium]|nr:MAG: glycosyltransferase family 2 protein [Sphingobacteriales bacterium]